MPLTRLIADVFGVVTIILVVFLVLLGLGCILYSVFFRCRITKQGYSQLGYFNKPWGIRIVLILFAIWWGVSEIVRLGFVRTEGRVLSDFDPGFQKAVCKFYIVSNLGFAEPCLLLTIVFLLRASLKQREFGASDQKWNWKTVGYILLWCLPMLLVQIAAVWAGGKIEKHTHMHTEGRVPHYFTRIAVRRKTDDNNGVIELCAYPLLSTILLSLYSISFTLYLLWLGRRMLSSVINKRLQRRVLFLILSVSSFFPLRIVLLGLSVFSQPERFLFEALVFTAFFILLCCIGSGIWLLVFCPVYDSLALKGMRDIETGRRPLENHHDEVSLIGNQSLLETSSTTSADRNSDDSTKRGSISFRTMLKDGTSAEVYEELSLFSPRSTHRVASPSPPGSPPLPGQPIFPLNQVSNY